MVYKNFIKKNVTKKFQGYERKKIERHIFYKNQLIIANFICLFKEELIRATEESAKEEKERQKKR